MRLDFTIDGLVAPAFSAKTIRLRGGEGATSEFVIGEITLYGRTWHDVRVACARLDFGRESIECAEGRADIGTSVPLAFTYFTRLNQLALVLYPSKGETWRIDARFGDRERRLELAVENGALSHLAGWVPADWPQIGSGSVNGTAVYSDGPAASLTADLALRGVSFADASGLHAGEKLDFNVKLGAERPDAGWRWQATLGWTAGEVFWQPLYMRGSGHTAEAEGTFDDDRVRVTRGSIALAGVGAGEGEMEWDRRKGGIVSADIRTGQLDAGALYTEVLKPFLFGTALGDMRVSGSTLLTAHWRNSELQALDLFVRDLSLEDQFQRFTVTGASGHAPWHRTEETRLDLALKGGELLKVPFGAVKVPVTMHGLRFRLESVDLPILDGVVTMRGFASDPPDDDWRWGFRGAIKPISMERLTGALGVPIMHGTLAADIPRVIYSKSTLQIDGALVFKVFDGTVQAKNVKLIEPFGKAPRLTADLEARGIDLDLLTRTYSFGSIQGRIDADVAGLELSNWHPVKFDIRVRNSPGDYPRKISQKAVENITALGGASAAAAIQRLFLRFFDQFDYEKLGWSCRLEQDVCHMGGVEDTSHGYVIVKGSGIPTLSVLGYNRAVNWDVLVERIKRIAQDNVQAVVQ